MANRKKINSKGMESDYEIRRQRNNDAVRKSREKARERAREVQNRIKALRTENEKLEENKKLLSKELSILKEMFLAYNSGATGKLMFRQLRDPAGSRILHTRTEVEKINLIRKVVCIKCTLSY